MQEPLRAVLVVSRIDLHQTTTCLREEGFRAFGVPDEVAAADLLRDFRPPVMVVDYPASWGREGSFLSLIRAYHPRAAVIGVLDRADPELEREAQSEGYDDIIRRPISRRALVEKVRGLLAAPDARA